jgi:hypothetical protein
MFMWQDFVAESLGGHERDRSGSPFIWRKSNVIRAMSVGTNKLIYSPNAESSD